MPFADLKASMFGYLTIPRDEKFSSYDYLAGVPFQCLEGGWIWVVALTILYILGSHDDTWKQWKNLPNLLSVDVQVQSLREES